jgi:uncharacterized OB-fold protein
MATPPDPPFWRLVPAMHRLVGLKCKKCGKVNFPPRKTMICVDCRGTEFDEVHISRKGKILTYVVVTRMPPGMVGPEGYAVIDTDDGARITAWSTDCIPENYGVEEGTPIKCNIPVELVIRIIGKDEPTPYYGFKFRPITE